MKNLNFLCTVMTYNFINEKYGSCKLLKIQICCILKSFHECRQFLVVLKNAYREAFLSYEILIFVAAK